LSGSIPSASVWLERAERSAGPWTRLDAPQTSNGEAISQLDAGARPDQSYWYRLVEGGPQGAFAITQSIEVRAAAGAFRIGVSPNPSSTALRVEFSLPQTGAVEMDLFDIAGRHVASVAHETFSPGSHAVDWSWNQARIGSAGVYLLRFRYPGGNVTKWVIHSR
jgi:hypothetical protein